MRKIIPDALHHNAPGPVVIRAGRPALAFGLALGLALTIGACAPENKTPDKAASTGPTDQGNCPVVIDTSAWTAFQDLTERLHTGSTVTDEDFLAFGDLPTVVLWRESLQPRSPSAYKLANWLEGAFWTELGREGKRTPKPDREGVSHSYLYSYDNRDLIDQRLAELSGAKLCQLDSLARYWIDPEKMPDPVTLHFLPAKAEIRIAEGSLFVDTGVVAAETTGQLIRQTAALLYRKYGSVPGSNPTTLTGEDAIAASFLVFMNEGITGWIEKTLDLEFAPSHPRLSSVKIIPEEFFLKAQETVEMLNSNLGPILADESEMAAKGSAFARHLVGMNALGMTGYAMTAVIAGHLGEERLKEVRHSVPAFIAAYQEAALQNPDPAPMPGSLGVDLITTVPALEPDIFAELHSLLTRMYPE